MHIHLGYDHNGFPLKDELIRFLRVAGYVVIDHGNQSLDKGDDYPDFALPVAEAVAEEEDSKGILICGSGGGVCIVANKVRGVRAAQVDTELQAVSAANDDMANVICLGSKVTNLDTMKQLITTFLQTTFEGGRHARRVGKVKAIEERTMKKGSASHATTTDVQIGLSILGADLLHLEDDMKRMEPYVDRIHFDVMDGHFVPNLSFGFPVLKQLKTDLPIDAHLMIDNPEEFIEEYAKYCSSIYVHYSVTKKHTASILKRIKETGAYAGLTLNPDIEVEEILPYLHHITHVLIMSVYPGFGGQDCIPEALDKIKELKKLKPELIISVDGGMNKTTAAIARKKGADIIVSGSYLLKAKDPKKASESLRS